MAGSTLIAVLESFTGREALGIALVAYVVHLAISIIYNQWFHPLSKYPGPFTSRFSNVPHMWHMIKGQEMARLCRLHQKYGGVVRLGPNELSYATSDAWKDIYGSGSKTANRIWTGFYDRAYPHANSLQFVTDESYHSQLRRTFLPAFADKALKEQEPLIKKYADQLIETLMEHINGAEHPPDQKASGVFDLVKIYNFVTMDVMGDLAFGQSFNMVKDFVDVPWIKNTFEGVRVGSLLVSRVYFPILKPIVLLFFWLNKKEMWVPYNITASLVDKRMAMKEKERPDIWGQVVKYQESNNAKFHSLTQKEMYGNGLLFIIAGTETSATALSGMTYLLLTHPDKLEKLTEEIRSAFASKEEITLAALAQLPYLGACIEEGIRVYPPIAGGMPRITPDQGMMIVGKWVPPQTVVYVTQRAAYRLPSNFRNPDDFIPERWTSSEYDSDNKSVFQPFLVGPKSCLGKPLAYQEMRLFLTYMIFHFDMELVGENRNWTDQRNFILWDKKPLMIRLKPVQGV